MRIVGPTPTLPAGVISRSYLLNNRSTGSLSASAVSTLISSALSAYATRSYVDSRDSLNATQAQIDAGDEPKLKWTTRNAVNGVAGLDAGGRVELARIPGNSTQRYPKGLYTPSSYGSGGSGSTTETTLFTHTVADPGYPYRLLVHGQLDVRTSATGDAPVIRARLGSSAGAVVATGTGVGAQYRYGVETFNRVSPNLGPGWEQVYTGNGTGHAETNGSKAFWVRNGTDPNRRGVFRKIGDFATTADDYQEVFYKIVDTAESDPGPFGSPARNRIYGRMNSNRTHYVAFDMTNNSVSLVYAAGGSEFNLVNPRSMGQSPGDELLAQFGYYAATNRRRFRLLRNNSVIIDHTDNGNVTSMGGEFLGWGFGMQAGVVYGILGPFQQALPATLDWVALSDPLSTWSADPEAYTTAVLVPTALSTQNSLVGSTTLHVTVRGTSSATATATTQRPRLHVLTIPA